MKNLITQLLVFLALSFFTESLFSQNVLDGTYIHENSPNRKFIPYTPLREADVMWSKRVWRTIDLREKINHPLYFPVTPINNRKCLFDVIKSALLSGALTAYSNPIMDDEFKVPMTKSEIEALMSKVDTSQVEDVDNPGTYKDVIVKTDLGPRDIVQYKLKEDWFFDKQKSVMEVRIIGICPMVEKKTESGEFKGYMPLFWIYYPEARPVFANAEVYNRHNDSERRTLEDIFWKRQFGSYIIKESNVYDRSIVEYKSGLDALLEAERIKEQIFNIEHDLWHF